MKYEPDIEEAKKLLESEACKTLPLSCVIDAAKTAAELYGILKNVSRNVFILESAEDKKNWGRYTFLGFDPKLELTCRNGRVTIKSGTTLTFENTSPHQYIRRIMEENKSPVMPGLPTFTGGLVGYLSYDFIQYSEPRMDLKAPDEEGFNDVDLMLFDKIIAIDNLENKLILIVNIKTENLEESYNRGIMDLQQLVSLVVNGDSKEEVPGKLREPLKPLFEKPVFCELVEKAKKHIYEGDIFQVVLSNRLCAGYEGSLFDTYCKLRKTNPSPYMFYFSSDDVEIAGASPETLVKVENGRVSTFPLAGTRPRGKTEEEDKALEEELLGDEKECAEHNMLVDLGRNDIGKISEFGSVKVEKYMSIERFSHVMHIGSTVCGKTIIKNFLEVK